MKLFIPAHISGFWYVFRDKDLMSTGSYGAGLILEPGLYIEDLESDCKVLYNNVEMDIKVYRDGHDIAGLECGGIKVSSPYNLGEGYGASAGITIGGLYFSQLKSRRRMTWIEIGRYAHIAEVKNITGYGDVIAEIFGGGLEIRVKPGAPGIGIIDKVPISRDIKVITLSLEKYSTTDMFQRFRDKLTSAGEKAYSEFLEEPTLEKFGALSHEFSLNTGMMSMDMDRKIGEVLKEEIRRGSVINYFIKKGLLVVIAEESVSSDLMDKLKIFGRPILHTINFSGCKIIY